MKEGLNEIKQKDRKDILIKVEKIFQIFATNESLSLFLHLLLHWFSFVDSYMRERERDVKHVDKLS